MCFINVHDWEYSRWDDVGRPNEICWSRKCKKCSQNQFLDIDGWCVEYNKIQTFLCKK